MPYHVSVTTIAREQHYRVVVVDELDRATARHLGDWLDAARLNPGASFEVDLSEARWVDERAVERLVNRHRSLMSDRRLELVGDATPAGSRLAAVSASAAVLVEPLLAVLA
jgi:hypothetical protein